MEGPKKTKSESFGALGSLAAQDSKTFLFFWDLQHFGSKIFVFLGILHGFGKVLLQNAPKTLRVPKKANFWCQNTGGPPKQKKHRLGAFGSLTNLAAQASIGFFGILHDFGKALLQNAPKTLKRWKVPKNQKNKSFGALGSLAAQDSKTLFFCVFGTYSVLGPKLCFLGSSMVLAWLCSKMLPKPGGVPKNPKFWRLQNFVFFGFFGTLQRFETKTLFFLGPSMVLARLCSKMLPKP